MFPLNQDNVHNIREHETFNVNFAHNEFYRNSAIPYCQRLLNDHMKKQMDEEQKKEEKKEKEE